MDAQLAWMAEQVYGAQDPGAQAQVQATDQSSIDQVLAAQWAQAACGAAQAGYNPQTAQANSAAAWSQGMQGAGVVVPPGKGPMAGKGKMVMPPHQMAPQVHQVQGDAINIAINTAMQNVEPDELISTTEGAWDIDTLKRRLAKYFRSAAKGLQTAGPYDKVINDYADAALGNVSWALQGTKWLAKADFTLVLEVAITELFPEGFKDNVPEGAAFEDVILQAHDRALEEARFSPVLMDTVKEIVEGKKLVNKVYNAAEAARRKIVNKMLENKDDSAEFFDIAENGLMGKIEAFARDWITTTMATFGDWPEGVLEQKDCQRLFDKLLANEECCLPRTLVRYMVEPLPDPWDFVAETVKGIYDAAAEVNAANEQPSKKKRKNTWAEGPNFMYKTERCTNMMETGTCRFGDWCVFAHRDEELAVHQMTSMQMKGALGKGPACFDGGPKGCGKGMEGGFSKGGCGKYAYQPYGPKGAKGFGNGKFGKVGGGPYGQAPYLRPSKGPGLRPSFGKASGGKGVFENLLNGVPGPVDEEEEQAWEALAASFEMEGVEGEVGEDDGQWELNGDEP